MSYQENHIVPYHPKFLEIFTRLLEESYVAEHGEPKLFMHILNVHKKKPVLPNPVYVTMSFTSETVGYILDWIGLSPAHTVFGKFGHSGQSASMDIFRDEDNFELHVRHAKKRILETLTDQDLWQMIQDKNRDLKSEFAEDAVKYLQRELNFRKNPTKFYKDDLSQIKEQVDILDVVEHYIGTIRYRPRALIKCPLPDHKDGTASFMIDTKKNLFKCFGCQKGGSQIDFIMFMEGIILKDAIKKLKTFL